MTAKALTKIPTPPPPGSQVFPFALGDDVRDKISGVAGTAMVRIFHISGCDTFIIEGPADKKKNERGALMDVMGQRLELVTAHPERHINEIPGEDFHVHLGDEVRDLVHGIEGVATHITTPLFGARQIQVAPKWDAKEKKLPEGWIVDAHHIEVVKPLNVAPKPAKQQPAPAPVERGATPLGRGGNW